MSIRWWNQIYSCATFAQSFLNLRRKNQKFGAIYQVYGEYKSVNAIKETLRAWIFFLLKFAECEWSSSCKCQISKEP